MARGAAVGTRAPRAAAPRSTAGPARSRRGQLLAAAAAGSGLAGLVWWRASAGSPGGSADADIQVAAALAGVRESEIQPSTGGVHVIYHSTAPLPSPATPRADGKPSLVWFSATW